MSHNAQVAAAHNAPRCSHTKVNGEQCQSPAMRGKSRCYYHRLAPKPDEKLELLPMLEDGDAIQVALMHVTHALINNTIETRRAALILYALQTASANLRRTSIFNDPVELRRA